MKCAFLRARRRGERAYSVDPVHVGADSGEDGGLLGIVAAEAGAEADDAVNLPASIAALAVQGASRVPLMHVTNNSIGSISVQLQTLHEMQQQEQTGNASFASSVLTLGFRLTLQPATTPSPPAQTILVVT